MCGQKLEGSRDSPHQAEVVVSTEYMLDLPFFCERQAQIIADQSVFCPVEGECDPKTAAIASPVRPVPSTPRRVFHAARTRIPARRVRAAGLRIAAGVPNRKLADPSADKTLVVMPARLAAR